MERGMAGLLIGSTGLFCATPQGYTRIGAAAFGVNTIRRTDAGLLLGAEGGLWQIPAGTDQLIQWHDETLTQVMDMAVLPAAWSTVPPAATATPDTRISLVVATAYGVTTNRFDELGAPRWQRHAAGLSPNRRFTNSLVVDAARPACWLAATEDGVLRTEDAGITWCTTSMSGLPVRVLRGDDGEYWAGADAGVWRSSDGVTWIRAGQGLEHTPVFALARIADGWLAGTGCGVARGDGTGLWSFTGAPLRVVAVAANRDRWWAGASPGGLWQSMDQGETWQRTGDFVRVFTIESPEVM